MTLRWPLCTAEGSLQCIHLWRRVHSTKLAVIYGPESCCVPDKPHVGNSRRKHWKSWCWVRGCRHLHLDCVICAPRKDWNRAIRESFQATPGCPMEYRIENSKFEAARTLPLKEQGHQLICNCWKYVLCSNLHLLGNSHAIDAFVMWYLLYMSLELCLQACLHQLKLKTKKQTKGVYHSCSRETVGNTVTI